MTRIARAALAATVACMVPAAIPATGQAPTWTVTSEVKLMPAKAGTAAQPRDVRLAGRFELKGPEGDDRPSLVGVTLLLSRRISYDATGRPACSRRTLQRRGLSGCPKASIIASSPAGRAAVVPSYPEPRITFINGYAGRAWVEAVYYSPMPIKLVEPLDIQQRDGKRWSHAFAFALPALPMSVLGKPLSAPASISLELGGRTWAPSYLVTDHGCPRRGFLRFEARFSFTARSDSQETRVSRARLSCR